MKKYIIGSMGLLFLFASKANAAVNFGSQDSVNEGLRGSEQTADVAVQTLIMNVAIFASLIAIPLTVGCIVLGIHLIGKKRKTLGIVIIVLSVFLLPIIWFLYSIATFIITKMLGA